MRGMASDRLAPRRRKDSEDWKHNGLLSCRGGGGLAVWSSLARRSRREMVGGAVAGSGARSVSAYSPARQAWTV